MYNLFNFGQFCPVLVEIQNFEVSLVEFRCYPSDIIVHVQVYRYVGFGSTGLENIFLKLKFWPNRSLSRRLTKK
jgi:hypothetical protein